MSTVLSLQEAHMLSADRPVCRTARNEPDEFS